MPPSGNHPVRAATNTSSSEVRSGGSEMQAIEAPRTMRRASAARTGCR